MRTLLNQCPVAFFSSGPVRKDKFKRAYFGVVFGRFESILFVSFFQGLLNVILTMIDGSEKLNR